MITTNIVDAIKVQFLRPIFEDDFPDKGMKAWLTDIEWSDQDGCYILYFDFTDFLEENKKYFKECYYPNRHTKELEESGRILFTALEAGYYEPKYSVYFSVGEGRDDAAFTEEIKNYLREVE